MDNAAKAQHYSHYMNNILGKADLERSMHLLLSSHRPVPTLIFIDISFPAPPPIDFDVFDMTALVHAYTQFVCLVGVYIDMTWTQTETRSEC